MDDIRQVLRALPEPDAATAAAAAAREPRLTKPPGALGRLEELSVWLSAWQGRHPPRVERVSTVVFAGNHGVTAQGVSAYPPEVTAQMVANFEAGGAAVNQICRAVGADLVVRALDLDRPTADVTRTPALSEDEFAQAFACGLAATAKDIDLLCLGEMGIGNTAVASCVALALFGGRAADWTGPGTGLDGDGITRKAAVVEVAVGLHRAAAVDALDLLRRLGGRELVAIGGAVAGARLRRIPVVLDGFIGTAAAAPLHVFRPGALDHCVVGHVSAEPGHRRLLEHLGKRPILDLGMRLGEGTGAALAAAVVRAAAACHGGMATFDEAGVSDRDRD